jgi:hypothetical protein
VPSTSLRRSVVVPLLPVHCPFVVLTHPSYLCRPFCGSVDVPPSSVAIPSLPCL